MLTSTAIAVPVTWGVWHPILLLPRQALTWNEEDLHVGLMHELGHIRHFDAASRWLATLTCAVQWWNPLVWAAARSWRSAQEHAADDLVLRCGSSAQNYAMQLLSAARSFQEGRFLKAPLLAMARPSSLETRLSAIMDAGRNRHHAGRKNLWAAAFAALLVMGGLSSMSLQGQPAKAATITEPAKPEAAQKKQVGTVVTILKAPADHFTGNPQISSGMILSPQEAEAMLKAPGVTSESTPRVVTWDRQKVIIGKAFDEEDSPAPVGKKITLRPAINGEAVHIDIDLSIPGEAGENGGLAAGIRTLSAQVDLPAGLTAVLVLPAVEKQPDIAVLISPVLVAPPPWLSAEQKAAKIILPQVQFVNANLDLVIFDLREQATKIDPSHKGINILIVGQPKAKLSLDLKEISLKEALGSVAKAANMDIKYDPYAVVLSPRGFLRPSVGLAPGSEIKMVAAKASSITLPDMSFHKAVLEDAVGYMRQEVQRANPEEIRFDIVLNDKSPDARQLISFHLQDISMLDLLHCIAILGDYSLEPKGNAMVFTPAAK